VSNNAPDAENRTLPPAPESDAIPRAQRAVEQLAALAFGVVLTLLALAALRDFGGVWRLVGFLSAAIVAPALAGFGFSGSLQDLRGTIAVGLLVSAGVLLPVTDPLGEATPFDAGSAWGRALAALGFALLCDLMLRSGIRARRSAGERLWLQRVALALMVFPLASFTGIVALDRREERLTRMEMASDLFGQLWESYPHWDRAPLKPRDLWAKYRSRLQAADRACGRSDRPCPPYLHALRDMFAELQNGHTEVLVPHESGSPAIDVVAVEGRAVIRRVEPGSDAESLGVAVGMEIVEVDGRAVDEALARVPRWRVAFTSAQTRAFAAYHALLEGPVGSVARIVVTGPAARRRAFALQRIPLRFDTEGDVQESPQEELEVRRSDGRNPTYLRLDGFEGDRLEELFDRAVDDELGSPGLILDLRGNYGGVLDHAFRMLGRFYSEPLVIGKHCLPVTQGEETGECTVHRIEPRGKTYRGPIAVLINEDVYSAGELAAYALCRGGRARCFGRTTAGETDCVFRLDLPGGVARMSWADFHPAFGPPLLGAGLEPDVRVEQTVADVRAARDPEYEEARSWLRNGAPRGTDRAALARPPRPGQTPELPEPRPLR